MSKGNRNRQRASSGSNPAPQKAVPATQSPTPESDGPSDQERRVDGLNALQQLRGADLTIAYVTNTRPGVGSSMTLDATRRVVDHLPKEKVRRIDLFLHSNGGESIVPWRLMTLLREVAEQVDVLVPSRAFSAGTLTALGADNILMHKAAMLGPIDPTVHDPFGPIDEETGQRPGVNTEDVAAYFEFAKRAANVTTEDGLVEVLNGLLAKVHPLTLGHVERGTNQAKLLGGKLLKLRNEEMDGDAVEKILKELTTHFWYHGHPINRAEAKDDLGLHVETPSDEVEAAMWELYVEYEEALQLEVNFDPISAALAAGGSVPQAGQGWKTFDIEPLRHAYVESSDRTDVFVQEIQVALGRSDDGSVAVNTISTDARWTTEP